MSSLRTEVPNSQEVSGNTVGPFTTGISSNADVVGNMNSQYKYMQESEGPYQEMTKNASNKYLEKIAGMAEAARGIGKAFRESSHIGKASLGMSGTGLAISAANYHNGKTTAKSSLGKENLERKSLTALNNINRTLSTSQIHPSPIPVLRQKAKKL